MIKLEINNQHSYRFDKQAVDSVVKQVSKQFKLIKNYFVSLVLVSNSQIKKINKIYRHKDKITDVLSFEETGDFVVPESEQNFLGEIFICWPRLIIQAKQKKHTQKKELAILLVHGLLHLLSYDHEQKAEAEEMESLEKELLSKIKI